jgi:hypothetical protein
MTIQNIPTVGWRLKFFNDPRGHGRDDFFSKMILHVSPLLSMNKIFSRDPTYPNHQMPTDRGGGLCYDFGKKINFMLHFPF